MKKVLLIIATSILMGSCYNDPQSESRTPNGIKVEYLFEQDGVKVYRFDDGGGTHYFTTRGETMTTHSTGKTSYQEKISNP